MKIKKKKNRKQIKELEQDKSVTKKEVGNLKRNWPIVKRKLRKWRSSNEDNVDELIFYEFAQKQMRFSMKVLKYFIIFFFVMSMIRSQDVTLTQKEMINTVPI